MVSMVSMVSTHSFPPLSHFAVVEYSSSVGVDWVAVPKEHFALFKC